MLVNSANIQGIFNGFKTLFNKALGSAEVQWTKIAMLVPSTTKQETYAWLGAFPKMREWIGDRVINKLKAHGYTIKNKKFEATIEVAREDIEDDTIGVYTPMLEELGRSAAVHPDELVFGLLAAGFKEPCYDGQPFFSDKHKDDDKELVQSNISKLPLTPEAYGKARTAMMSLTDSAGKPLSIRPGLLVVPPQLEEAARKILKADTLVAKVNGADQLVTNIYKDSAELLVSTQLAGKPKAWYLLDISHAVKPIIYQERKKPEFVSKDDPKDDNAFMRAAYIYGVDNRCNAGYGLWQLAYGSTGE